jgi:C4-dicarboxylate-specific signal transduction histidine kinase
MRSLTVSEVEWVSGGAEVTVSSGSASVTVKGDTRNFGQALINIYEGAVDATSHVIERVVNVFKGEK